MRTAALGYASVPPGASPDGPEADEQRRAIGRGCRALGLQLAGLACEPRPADAAVPHRPALAEAIRRVEAGEAACLVVSELTRQVTVNALPVARINILNAEAEPGQRNTQPLAGQEFVLTARTIPALPAESPAPGCPPLPGSPEAPGASDAEGEIAGYAWDLDNDGDFDDASGIDALSQGRPAGTYTVRLRVADQHGATPTATLTFRVNSAPSPSFVFEPSTPVIDQPVTFSSTASDDEDGTRLTYSWDLDDDGTFCETGETGPSVRRAFATAASHRVRLRVTDSGGITREATRQVVVQATRPDASFSWSPGTPLPGEAVTFAASASSPTGKPIAAIEWDFSYDRSTGRFDVEANGARVSHIFPSAGPRTVALRVRESGGGTLVVHDTVTVNAPPQAGFTVSPQRPIAGQPVTLASTSLDPDGPLVRQDWDLDGDGLADDASAAVVFATFHRSGVQPVLLRVTDAHGAVATARADLAVAAAPRSRVATVSAVVSIRGRLVRARTRVTRLAIRAQRGARVVVRCRGRGCPRRIVKRSRGKTIRFRRFERTYRPRMRVVVRVTRRGLIGKETTFVIRRGRPPLRRDLCLRPGSSKATRCSAD
jgi:PKD repeat protein